MYIPKLSVRQTQSAIQDLKKIFHEELKKNLNLTRATAPLFVSKESGLNDGLNGEEPVWFLPRDSKERLEVVHSLAKWKRYALQKYHFAPYEGLYTDMNAIRREEILDNLHSYYVDQWDWEKVILRKDRNLDFLKQTVNQIYEALKATKLKLQKLFPTLTDQLANEVYFISSQELEDLYPNLSIQDRETQLAKEKGAIFVYQIGYPLKSKLIHSKRAFDYDDWDLNGDLIVYSHVLQSAIELSSMGIRVDQESIVKQSGLSAEEVKKLSPYHKAVVEENLPLTIGGGIGQSRVSMFLLEKAHIGEVQASYWPEEYREKVAKEGIELL
ncbi:Aspartate--ammonia ligase [Mycoplasmopsis gallopavonis]|uniref:Aspartate--ammonia ligase n=1 Tax=Mycoplasmopsis gallopavonis TaxID=76629 RepID=A0A449AZ40_9BACT|nr:aspartate--ammonia ligase [Mycoplasmopsis gallopavonis]VEU72762.1 Aspartate--ammonia ligase [Mycoplasmopsis gallopavonis]